MKQLSLYLLFSILLTGYNITAMEENHDPFAKANELYAQSKWQEARKEFEKAHKKAKWLEENTSFKINAQNLYRGHVNYADVLFAHGATAWATDKEESKKLMIKACKHWKYRLLARQFGRAPLANELDDSDINGKKVVVYNERPTGGALGDTFNMSALMRYLKEKGAYIIFVPQKPIAQLYTLANTIQSTYVDEIALHGETLPEHDYEIYLWSILKHYLQDPSVEKPFPMEPWLSGGDVSEFIAIIEKQMNAFKEKNNCIPLITAGWYRSAGPNVFAADWRTLARDPGAHNILGVIENLPVLFINLEGFGHRPISENEFEKLKDSENLDSLDITSHDTSHVINFPKHFDNKIAFAHTLGIMEYIKSQNGILIGCDTSLCNAAAGVKKNPENPLQSVLIVLNAKADMRWGIDDTSPRNWHQSEDVRVYQAPEQNDWKTPLQQMREDIIKIIASFLKKK